MYINKNRIRNIDKYLTNFNLDEKLYIVINDIPRHKQKLISMGFSSSLPIGEKILPSIFGSLSSYNANGKYEKLRDLPKEVFYQEQSRNIKDWHGNYHLVSTSMRYERFQTKLINAPSQELIILKDDNNEIIVSSEVLIMSHDTKELIKHTINLFLELFGECNIVDNEFLSRQKTRIKRVNWNILPKGLTPWSNLRKSLTKLLDSTDIGNKEDTLKRFEYINSFSPNFVATGNGGFNDYVVFGFEDRNLYVLENSFAGNATYIFNNNWENLSQLSKAEILAKQSIKKILI